MESRLNERSPIRSALGLWSGGLLVGTVWPLIGRDDELSELTAIVRSPARRSAVLAGPAGVGKSRLAVECLAEMERAGLPVARATATRSAAHLPFGALAALLPPAEEMASGAPQDYAAFLRRCCSALAERGRASG